MTSTATTADNSTYNNNNINNDAIEVDEADDCKQQPLQSASEYDLTQPFRVVVDPQNKGGSEKLRIENFELPSNVEQLGVGNVLIFVKRSGVNFIDTYHRSGLYPNESGFIGGEGAGIVVQIGSNVANYKIGDNVFWFSNLGSYATHLVIPANKPTMKKIPPQITDKYADDEAFRISASIGVQALTAHYLCQSTFKVTETSTVLIHAGAGGTGGLLVQMCKKVLNAQLVIVTVGSAAKAKLAIEYGADHAIIYTEEDFHARVMDITENAGVDVVFDGVGLATYEKSMQSTKQRGVCIFFGNASGAVPAIDPLDLCKYGSIFITRPTLKHHVSGPQELERRYEDIFRWIDEKLISIFIGHEFALSQAFVAHNALESRSTTGKILLRNEQKSLSNLLYNNMSNL